MLWQHCSSTLGTNFNTMFKQHCVNFVSMSIPTLGTDIETTFRQCCLIIGAQCWDLHWDNVQVTLCEHYGNVLPTLGIDVETMFRQQCVNVASMLVSNFRSRMTVAFKFEFSTQLQHQHASLHWHNHIYKHLRVILPTVTVKLMGKWWILKKFPQ